MFFCLVYRLNHHLGADVKFGGTIYPTPRQQKRSDVVYKKWIPSEFLQWIHLFLSLSRIIGIMYARPKETFIRFYFSIFKCKILAVPE